MLLATPSMITFLPRSPGEEPVLAFHDVVGVVCGLAYCLVRLDILEVNLEVGPRNEGEYGQVLGHDRAVIPHREVLLLRVRDTPSHLGHQHNFELDCAIVSIRAATGRPSTGVWMRASLCPCPGPQPYPDEYLGAMSIVSAAAPVPLDMISFKLTLQAPVSLASLFVLRLPSGLLSAILCFPWDNNWC